MATTPARISDEQLLARLVGFDTVSQRSNLPLVDFLAAYLDRPGVRLLYDRSEGGDKANLVVFLGPEVDPERRDGLLLSGHTDVVPAEEPGWESDPFELVDRGDRWVGRGSADMKGFVALAANLAAGLDPARLAHPLVLLFTYDEELGTVGAADFVRRWPRERPLPRRSLVGEPTSLHAVRVHKGHAKLRLTVDGESAHSAYPQLGRSAIEPAARAVTALAELRGRLEGEPWPHGELFPQTPFVTLNVGTIHGGTAVNVVPECCVVELGFRTLPGVEAAALAELARQAVQEALDGAPHRLELLQESPPLLVADDNPLYRELCALVDQEETVSVSYASDAGWLQTLGMDCLLWGPGDIEVAHRPNEWLPKDEMERAAGLLRRLVERHCRPGG